MSDEFVFWIVLDQSCICCCGLPKIYRRFGINAAERFKRIYGEHIARKTGNPNITFGEVRDRCSGSDEDDSDNNINNNNNNSDTKNVNNNNNNNANINNNNKMTTIINIIYNLYTIFQELFYVNVLFYP